MNGDLQGKTARVVRELQQLKFPGVIDEVGLRLGDPLALLPILHYVLLKFSRHVAQCIHKAGYELQGKTDQKFVEAAFKLFRDCFSIKTVLTPGNFLEQGFAERKLILISDAVQCCKKLHNDEIRKERLAALKTKQGTGAEARLYEPTRKTPEVKVVRGTRVIKQVVSPLHLPNSSDGGQSRFKITQTVELPPGRDSRMEAPASAQATRASSQPPQFHTQLSGPLHGYHASQQGSPQSAAAPHAQHSVPAPCSDAWQQDKWRGRPAAQYVSSLQAAPCTPAGLELTFKPPALSSLATPIHGWFVNPAFNDELEEQQAELEKQGEAGVAAAQQQLHSLNLDNGAGDAAPPSFAPNPYLRLPNGHGSTKPGTCLPRNSGAAQERPEGGAGLVGGMDSERCQGGGQPSCMAGSNRPSAYADYKRLTDSSDDDDDVDDLYGNALEHVHDGVEGQHSYGQADTMQHSNQQHAHVPQHNAVPQPQHPLQHVSQTSRAGQEVSAAAHTHIRQDLEELCTLVRSLQADAVKTRSEAHSSIEVLQARVTVLEGRVRHLECELEVCVRRGEYHYQPSPGNQHSQPLVLDQQQQQQQQHDSSLQHGLQHAQAAATDSTEQQQVSAAGSHGRRTMPASVVTSARPWGADVPANMLQVSRVHQSPQLPAWHQPEPSSMAQQGTGTSQTTYAADAVGNQGAAQVLQPPSHVTTDDVDQQSRQWNSATTTRDNLVLDSQDVSSDYQRDQLQQHQQQRYTGWIALDPAAAGSSAVVIPTEEAHTWEGTANSDEHHIEQQDKQRSHTNTHQPQPGNQQHDGNQQQQESGTMNGIEPPSFGQQAPHAADRDGQEEPVTERLCQQAEDGTVQAVQHAHGGSDMPHVTSQPVATEPPLSAHASALQELMPQHTISGAQLECMQHTSSSNHTTGAFSTVEHAENHPAISIPSSMHSAAVSLQGPAMPSLAVAQSAPQTAPKQWHALGGGAPTPSFSFEPARVMSEVRASQSLSSSVRHSSDVHRLTETCQSWSYTTQPGGLPASWPSDDPALRTSTSRNASQLNAAQAAPTATVPASAHSMASSTGYTQPRPTVAGNGSSSTTTAVSTQALRNSWTSTSDVKQAGFEPQASTCQAIHSTVDSQLRSSARHPLADIGSSTLYRYNGLSSLPVSQQPAMTTPHAAQSSSNHTSNQASGGSTALPGSTSQLISSLMSRYSEAQTFLAEIKRR